MHNLTPQQFLAARTQGTLTLDVRQPEELAIAALTDSVNIPLNELPARAQELDPQQPLLILCHHGVRSEMAGRFLEQQGFSAVSHLVGGIDAWSMAIDPSVPRY